MNNKTSRKVNLIKPSQSLRDIAGNTATDKEQKSHIISPHRGAIKPKKVVTSTKAPKISETGVTLKKKKKHKTELGFNLTRVELNPDLNLQPDICWPYLRNIIKENIAIYENLNSSFFELKTILNYARSKYLELKPAVLPLMFTYDRTKIKSRTDTKDGAKFVSVLSKNDLSKPGTYLRPTEVLDEATSVLIKERFDDLRETMKLKKPLSRVSKFLSSHSITIKEEIEELLNSIYGEELLGESHKKPPTESENYPYKILAIFAKQKSSSPYITKHKLKIYETLCDKGCTHGSENFDENAGLNTDSEYSEEFETSMLGFLSSRNVTIHIDEAANENKTKIECKPIKPCLNKEMPQTNTSNSWCLINSYDGPYWEYLGSNLSRLQMENIWKNVKKPLNPNLNEEDITTGDPKLKRQTISRLYTKGTLENEYFTLNIDPSIFDTPVEIKKGLKLPEPIQVKPLDIKSRDAKIKKSVTLNENTASKRWSKMLSKVKVPLKLNKFESSFNASKSLENSKNSKSFGESKYISKMETNLKSMYKATSAIEQTKQEKILGLLSKSMTIGKVKSKLLDAIHKESIKDEKC